MKTLLVLVGWCILFVLCWPVALLALVLWPIVWVLSLPFRLVGITFEALFALLRAGSCSRRRSSLVVVAVRPGALRERVA